LVSIATVFEGTAMQKFLSAALLALAVAASPAPALSQGASADVTDMQALRQAVKTDKHALVASTLDLSPAQAKKFWPIYDSYQRSIDMLGRARSVSFEETLNRDRDISNVAAKQLALRNMQADEAEMKARRKMYNALMRALPASKAARYLQLEQKIRAVQAYDIAQAFPLVK
jgi:Spy/CpxP family protein refolding chaperone